MELDRLIELGSWSAICKKAFGTAVSIYCFGNGWKAVPGHTRSAEADRGYMMACRPAASPEEACKDLLLREHVLDFHDLLRLEWKDEGLL